MKQCQREIMAFTFARLRALLVGLLRVLFSRYYWAPSLLAVLLSAAEILHPGHEIQL